jgi:hypothetical protein
VLLVFSLVRPGAAGAQGIAPYFVAVRLKLSTTMARFEPALL